MKLICLPHIFFISCLLLTTSVITPAEAAASASSSSIMAASTTTRLFLRTTARHSAAAFLAPSFTTRTTTRRTIYGLVAATATAAFSTSTANAQPSSSTHTSLPPCARVIPVPILSDNYAYLIVDPKTGKTACVDPAEPDKILAAASKEGLLKQLSTLLCTHKHWDHAGGNEAMAAQIPGLEVVTTKFEEIPAATVKLGDDDVFTLGSLSVRALYTPCHTRGHVLFLITPQEEEEMRATAPILFSGDTVFVGGCGRFFEGNGAEMVDALMGRVAKLPAETLIYCGHEYTKSNLAFASYVEPENEVLKEKVAWVSKTLAGGGYTVPTTVGSELETNPFMRVNVPEVVKAAKEKGGAKAGDPATVMSVLREMKNNFKG